MKGALIFAFNNERVDYVSMAAWSAHRIRRHLGLPVAVVTDCESVPDAFDHVVVCQPESGNVKYYDDLEQTVSWFNGSRTNAWALTPWDTTLLLDADYVVSSSALAPWVHDYQCDLLCFDRSHSVACGNYHSIQPTFGTVNFPMLWATVMIFQKNRSSEMIFSAMDMVKNHWAHYRALYGIHNKTYRNDYALSIACALESGHTLHYNTLPWSMAAVLPEHDIRCRGADEYEVTWDTGSGSRRRISTAGLDLHVMCKKHLGDIVAAH